MSGTKILVVDDDVELRDLLREYLTQQGFAVSVMHDGDGLAARLDHAVAYASLVLWSEGEPQARQRLLASTPPALDRALP